MVLLGSLGVDPKEYLQHQKAALGRLFQWLDTDGDRQIVRPLNNSWLASFIKVLVISVAVSGGAGGSP